MRWALVVLLLVAASASARVIMLPEIARSCPEGKTWDAVMKCVGEHGRAKVEKQLPHARLVRLTSKDGGQPAGLYLYVESNGWKLGGMYENAGELLGFDIQTLGRDPTYRFEVGTSQHADDKLVLRREQVYCGGTGYRCTTVTVACDVLAAGKAIETFRGTVSWHHDHLRITGDRTHAAAECFQAEEVPVMLPSIEID